MLEFKSSFTETILVDVQNHKATFHEKIFNGFLELHVKEKVIIGFINIGRIFGLVTVGIVRIPNFRVPRRIPDNIVTIRGRCISAKKANQRGIIGVEVVSVVIIGCIRILTFWNLHVSFNLKLRLKAPGRVTDRNLQYQFIGIKIDATRSLIQQFVAIKYKGCIQEANLHDIIRRRAADE